MAGGRSRWAHRALGATFVGAGAMHFVIPQTYESIVPGYLPAHRELVYASGVAEIVGGLGALDSRTRRLAGWWLAATLLAVFPANIGMALYPDRYAGIPQWALYARLPVQGLLIAWALWATRPAR
ncbi:MAG: DoxX family protein [Solirubrobacteraceae bacterium]